MIGSKSRLISRIAALGAVLRLVGRGYLQQADELERPTILRSIAEYRLQASRGSEVGLTLGR